MSSTANTTRAVTGNQFGTFAGVFTPSILTILGVIMFMRAGYVVGQAGVSGALLILLAAEVIAVLTALSMSAIATNTPVRGGGAYFLISRVLGPQYGGAIGLALYIAQALSVPFYILGFTASVTQSFPSLAEHYRSIALATAGLLFVINYISSSLAIKTQYVVMTLLSLSILTFLGGAVLRFDPELLAANWSAEYSSPDLSFWVVFAVYFPAVTGFLAGVNMSGDLKDPSKSLVKGSFWAVGLGFVIYAIQIVLSGASQARPDLIARPYEMLMQNALFGASFLVIGGVFSATISSAVGSFLGAPRVLQAVARDQILPRLNVFAKGSKEKDEPRVALWLTLVLSLIVIFFAANPERDSTAAFDAIASLVTMIFLCTYGMINLAAFVESYGRNPSFRPRFRFFHWSLSLLGFLACFAVMLLIDPVAAGGAILVLSGLYAYISRRLYTSAFGDARRGFLFNIAIRSLQRLRGAKADPKNWRPTILVMAGSSTAHLTQIRYGDWLEGGCGLVTAARVIVADQVAQADRRRAALRDLEEYIEEHALSVFPEIVLAKELDEGMRVLVQAHSIGPLKSNTVVFGWPRTVERAVPFFRHLQDCSRLGKSVVAVVDRGLPERHKALRRIDIWWRGQANGSLMVILAHLLTQNMDWRHARMRILRIIRDDTGREEAHQALEQLVHGARVDADVAIIVSTKGIGDTLGEHSGDADVVFLGLELADEGTAPEAYQRYESAVSALPTTLLVHSSGDADVLQ